MPLPVVADAFQVRLQYLVQTQVTMNVFAVIDTSTTATAEGVLTDVAAILSLTGVSPFELLSDQVGPGFLIGVTPFDGVTNEILGSGEFPEGVTGVEIPGQNAVVVKYSAATGGRSGRGRMFLSGLLVQFTEASNANVVNTQYVTEMDDRFGEFRQALVDSDLVLGVFSRTDAAVRAVVNHAVNPFIASQRRRGQQ